MLLRLFFCPFFGFSVLSFSLLGTCRRVQHGQYSLVVVRRSALSRSSPFGLTALFCVAWVGADAGVSIVVLREFYIPVLTSTASPRSRHKGTLRLPVVNLAPRWEGGMVGVRNERQTHLPSPPVWTAPLRSSRLSSPSRGIVARRVMSSAFETPESSFSETLYIYLIIIIHNNMNM